MGCDEIWAYYFQKKKRAEAKGALVGGDVWTWTAFDPDSKMMIAWLVSPSR